MRNQLTSVKTRSRFFSAILLASSLVSSYAAAAVEEYKAAPGASATFEALGRPSMLKIKGEGAKVNGAMEISGTSATGKFEIDLNQFETGISLRDRHMREKYLETAAHPKAHLNVQSVELPQGWAPGQNVENAKFKGELTLKGVTKPVQGTVRINGASLATEAEFGFSLSQFPVGVPSYMGITVADNVSVKVAIPSFVRK